MDYASAKGTHESVNRFLGFKDDLYREMLVGATVNYLEANSGNARLVMLKELFERDAEGNYSETPKEIVSEVQNIYIAVVILATGVITSATLMIMRNLQRIMPKKRSCMKYL